MQVLKESVKNAIVEGAIAEFFEKGYQNANMRRISDSANITVGNIYRYFENKEALFNAVLMPAQIALNDLESFDRKLHITHIETKRDAEQIVTYVMNVLRPYTKELYIMIFNSNSTYYLQVKNQLELLVVNKIREFNPGKFDNYFIRVVASSFITTLFTVFKDNVEDMDTVQSMMIDLMVFFFRDLKTRLF